MFAEVTYAAKLQTNQQGSIDGIFGLAGTRKGQIRTALFYLCTIFSGGRTIEEESRNEVEVPENASLKTDLHGSDL